MPRRAKTLAIRIKPLRVLEILMRQYKPDGEAGCWLLFERTTVVRQEKVLGETDLLGAREILWCLSTGEDRLRELLHVTGLEVVDRRELPEEVQPLASADLQRWCINPAHHRDVGSHRVSRQLQAAAPPLAPPSRPRVVLVRPPRRQPAQD